MRHGWQKQKNRRENIAVEVLPLYKAGFGHKAIAKQTGFSPRIVRVVLIEQGVYQPGKLIGGEKHRAAIKANNAVRFPVEKRAIRKRLREVVSLMRHRVKKCLTGRVKLRKKRRFETDAQYFRWRWDNDPAFHLYQVLRRRMRKVIIDGVKSGKSLELVGCSTAHLRAHIERQFKPGMTWQNLGIGKGKWNVDHIMPCAAFDLTNPAHQKQCFHWTNLRPLWSSENIRKSNTITHPQLALCL
jgi:hypothetical protein